MRSLLALMLLGGCDSLFNLDTVPLPDDGATDGATDAPITATAIAYVQGLADNTTGVDTQRHVTLPAPVQAGDLLVALVSWGPTFPGIASVGDDVNGPYMASVQSSYAAVFFLPNVKAGMTTVVVAFAGDTAGPDLRVLEYSGIAATNPIDRQQAISATGMSVDSGVITTSHAYDLLVCGTSVAGQTTGDPAMFTRRFLTAGNSSYAGDRIVAAADSYECVAQQDLDGTYTATLVAFKGALDAPP